MRLNRHLTASLFLIFLLCFSLAPFGFAQSGEGADHGARASQWDGYPLPPGQSVRYVDKAKGWWLWRPAAWGETKNGDKTVVFTDRDRKASLTVMTEDVPEGYGIANYATSFVQQLRYQQVNLDTVAVRRVWPGGVEGREITLELERSPGDVVRETVWMAEAGPQVYLFIFVAPVEEHEKQEPLFKRMMLSVRVGAAGHWDETFEKQREHFAGLGKQDSGAGKTENAVGPEVEAALIASSIRTGQGPSASLAQRLSALLDRAPDAVLDLMTDHDPQVRAAAVRAFSRLKDPFMPNILVWAMMDNDAYCSSIAAQALAGEVTDSGYLTMIFVKNALPMLSETAGAILNLAASLSDDRARVMADELLNSDNSRARVAGLHLAITLPLRGLQLPVAKLLQSKDQQFLPLLAEAVRLRQGGSTVPELLKLLKAETEYGAARLLGEVAPAEVAAQLEQRIKEIDARLEKIAPALKPGVTSTFTPTGVPKKGAGKGKDITVRAAPPPMPAKPRPEDLEAFRIAEARGALVTAVDKIRFRDRYARAKDGSERIAIYNEARNDSFLADWAEISLRSSSTAKAEPAGIAIDTAKLGDAPTTGETLFPADSTLYLMAPNFEQTLARLDAALSGVQMETVRDQMTFALLFKTMKAGLAGSINAGNAGSVSAALGLDLKSPLAVARWNSGSGGGGMTAHSAVLARVTDRARFERMLGLYEQQVGGFDSFATVSSAVTRFAGIIPAAVPLAMAAAFSDAGLQTRGRIKRHLASAMYFRREQIGSLPATVIEKLMTTTQHVTERERICVAYLDTTAVITPSRAALIDLLNNSNSRPAVAQSASFTQARAEAGEVIFFSRPDRLYRDSIASGTAVEDLVVEALTKALGPETGALRLTPTTWETVFHLNLQNSDWLKSFRPFAAKELAAPRDLLPDTTLVYAGTVFDPANLIKALKSLESLPSPKKEEEKKDPEKKKKEKQFDDEVAQVLVPNLQGEAAFALLSLSPLFKGGEVSLPAMAFALRLKNGETAKLFRAGKLFTGASMVPDQTALGSPVATLDVISEKLFFTVTDDYLVIAESAETLKLLEAREKFAATRDFIRSAETLPENLALFTTCNLNAAFSEALRLVGRDENAVRIINVFGSITHAFHSQRAFIAINSGADGKQVALDGRLTVSFDREGRYAVGKVSPKDDEFDVANALIAPRGLGILQPTRLESMKLRVTARQPDVIARVRDDIGKFPWQKAEAGQGADKADSLVYTTAARRIPDRLTVKLPVTAPEFQPYLKSTARINTTAPQIVGLAQQIAGDDKDGRSVARKLGEWTHANLKWKRVESSTVETLASREADCLEHSELYVALARSLGLPARVVSGAAYGGGSFGAHAWVEIYLGKWVEVDPTWGLMDYVDATHLRFDGDSFAEYAMLNQVELEVLETRSTVADFQRDPARLVKEFARPETEPVRALAFDLALTAERALGAESFAKLDDRQRAAVINAFDRAASELIEDWAENWADNPSILSSEVKDNHATLLAVFGNGLLRFHLASRDGAWYITEVENLDEASEILAEPLRVVTSPAANIAGIRRIQFAQSDRALKQLDQLIAARGESAPLLLVKAQTLAMKRLREGTETPSAPNEPGNGKAEEVKTVKSEKKTEQPDATAELLEQITARWPDYAPAQYALAEHYKGEEGRNEKSIAAYQRYAKLVPLDPRPWQKLGDIFEELKQFSEAEAAYREAISRDRGNYQRHITLAGFYFNQSQDDKVRPALLEAFKVSPNADEVFDALDNEAILFDENDDPIKERCHGLELLLTGFPKQLAASREGLRLLSRTQEWQENYDAAIKSEQRALALGPEAYDHVRIAILHRKARRFVQSLAAADQAAKLNPEYAGAHFERACNLARLNRRKEAVKALEKAVQLDSDYQELLESEEDLNSLTGLPEFKALLPKPEEGEKKEEKPAPPKKEKM